MAHVLATIAGYKGYKQGRWFSAAALDAYRRQTSSHWRKARSAEKRFKVEMENNRIVFVLTLDGDKLSGEIDDAGEPGKVLARVELSRDKT
jgi:hypothetical protein